MPDRPKTKSGRGSLPGRVCSSDVTEQVNQRRRNSGTGPTSKKVNHLSARAAGTVQTRYRVPAGETEGAGGVLSQ